MIPPMLEWYTWTVNVQIVHSISNLLIEHNKIHLWQTHMEDLYLVSNEWTNEHLFENSVRENQGRVFSYEEW